MVAEDDMDVETLQAQIDMTMSFAHNLATSWIKPSHLAQLASNGVNAAQMLEEELRRPPRLGVGAPIPTATPLVHEASQLKRRLGKSGAKREDIAKPQPQDSYKSDDEEHKGRPAKRKTKVDPFGHEGSKKQRTANFGANQCLSTENVSKPSDSSLKNLTLRRLQKHNSSSGEEKQGGSGQRPYVTKQEQPATLIPSPPVRSSVHITHSSTPSASTALSPSKCYESTRVHTNPISDKTNPLVIPLLNLDGPVEPADKSGDPSNSNIPRRKRKRRKRKKTRAIASMGDSLH